MNKDIFLKIVNILAVKVIYHEGGEICSSIVTKNKKYFTLAKNKNFFDLIKNKSVYLDKILDFEMLFCNHISISDLLNDKLIDDKKILDHFEWNFKYIKELKKNYNRDLRNLKKQLNQLDLNEIKEYCNENLFFNPIYTEKVKIIKEALKRKKFLLTTIDHGIFTKILNIFDITDEDFLKRDIYLVDKCKNRWKAFIDVYVDKAKNKLKKELEENKEDSDLTIEVEEIVKMLDVVSHEIENQKFETPRDVASYWPKLLMPAPFYVSK